MAILLDSYKNGGTAGNFPLVSRNFSIFSNGFQISGFVSNGTWSFDHDTDGADQNIGKCLSGHRNKQRSSMIRVRQDLFNYHSYNRKSRYLDEKLTVRVDPDGTGDFRKLCFEVDGVVLPTGLYMGITSATGDLTDNHDVHGLKIWQLDSKTPNEPRNQLTPDVKREAPPISVGTFHFKLQNIFSCFFQMNSTLKV